MTYPVVRELSAPLCMVPGVRAAGVSFHGGYHASIITEDQRIVSDR